MFPLMFMALSSSAFDRTTELPGFPAGRFVPAVPRVHDDHPGSVVRLDRGGGRHGDRHRGWFLRASDRVARRPVVDHRGPRDGVVRVRLLPGVALLRGRDRVRDARRRRACSGCSGSRWLRRRSRPGSGSIASSFAIRTGSTEAVQGALPVAVLADVPVECVLPAHPHERLVQDRRRDQSAVAHDRRACGTR